jgi:hypothetical protein
MDTPEWKNVELAKELDRLHGLWPNLTEDQLLEARDNLRSYLGVVMRIYDRLKAEKRANNPPE